MEVAAVVAQGGAAERNSSDGALAICTAGAVDDDIVADAVLVLEDDKEAGEAVLYDTLRTKTKCHTKDAGAGENWCQINAKFF